MSYYLFLDDQKDPNNIPWVNLPDNVKWLIARDYKDFVKAITENGLPSFISFDHNLDPEHNKLMRICHDYRTFIAAQSIPSGYDCARWLVEYCKLSNLDLPPYTIHSMNGNGTTAIKRNLERYTEGRKTQTTIQ